MTVMLMGRVRGWVRLLLLPRHSRCWERPWARGRSSRVFLLFPGLTSSQLESIWVPSRHHVTEDVGQPI